LGLHERPRPKGESIVLSFSKGILPRTKVPETYPLDLHWKGASPKEEYNCVLVDVQPGKPTKFTLNRFRPGSAVPFATVELLK